MKKRQFFVLVLFTTFCIGINAQVFIDPAGNSGYMINKSYVKKPIPAPYGMKPGASGYMIDNCRISGVPISAPTQVESTTTTNSSSYSSSSSSSSTKQPCHGCNGTGRVKRHAPISGFGINTEKVKCSECGEMMFKYDGHIHKTCESCHGRRYL